MNASRRKFNRFSSFSNVPSRGQPHFYPVRMRQNMRVEKTNQISNENIPKYSLLQGALEFPIVHRSDKSNDIHSALNDFSFKSLKPSNALNFNSCGTVLSMLKHSSESSSKNISPWNLSIVGSKSNSTSESCSTSHHESSFQTPVNVKNRHKAKSSSVVKQLRLSNSASTSDSHFFTTPRKRNSTRTPKSSSSAVSDLVNNVVVAITEGRGQARGEVGIAAIDVKRPFLTLCEISDTQTYMNTLSKINILNPAEILVPSTFYDNVSSNKLYQMISENFPNTTLLTVQRKFFNESCGLQQIQNICLPEYSSILLVIPRKFYALAAASALLKYAEFEQNITFTPRSVRVNFESGNDIAFIDLETSQKLELVISQNMRNTCPENTLYGVLNNCSTISGQRRLRSHILQPSSDEKEINKRLDCVEELISNQELFFSLKSILPKFWDVEQLLSLSTQIANLKDNSKAVELQINYILLLKTSLEAISPLQKSLQNTKANFFSSFCKNLENVQYRKMLDKIYEIINDDAHLSQKFDICQFQRCFCIKTGIDAFLDVARLAYTELVEDFNGVVDDLVKEYQLPLTVRTLRSKGPVLQMKLNGYNHNFNVKDLPSIFIQVEKSRSSVTMTTKELLFLKERMNHFIQEIQLLSSVVIFEMMKEIRQYVGSLFILCEYIAELDLITSFAQISKSFAFVRPSFAADCTKLKSSEHPILHRVSISKPVANDVFASTNNNMSIITGPNMGGKSIYIRQIALLQVMAQIGCYVPAEFAQFRITDRIFSRIGFNDDIECNASSFIVELKEMHYIMKSVTSHSLIIIDELCRGTSTEEGASLAWAILEELQATTAFCFVTTHFLFLTKLEEFYYNVNNWHFDTLEINSDAENVPPTLVYTHHLVPGVIKLEHYGLKLARITAIPQLVLQSAEEIVKILNVEWKATSIFEGDSCYEKKIDIIIVKMLEMLDNQTLTIFSVKDMIEHALDIGLNAVEDANSQNRTPEEISQEHTAAINASENNSEDDISENMQLNVDVVEGDVEVLVEAISPNCSEMVSKDFDESLVKKNGNPVQSNYLSNKFENILYDDNDEPKSYNDSALTEFSSKTVCNKIDNHFFLSQTGEKGNHMESDQSYRMETFHESPNFSLMHEKSSTLNGEMLRSDTFSVTLDHDLNYAPEKNNIHFFSA